MARKTLAETLAAADATPTVANVLAVYRSATDAQLAEGIHWYEEAHTAALVVGQGDVERGAGIIAALSPQTTWSLNQRYANQTVTDGVATGNTPANNDKATRILKGEAPLDVLGGNKVRNFYLNIMTPSDPNGGVTVDRHAFDIAVGRVTDDETRGLLNRKGGYDAFADVYHEAARIAGVGSPQMQAVTWVVWRETVIRTSAAVRREASRA